ncbi:hypothetical protein IEO21_09602 [Rhodonia placenta]|uniref:Uncharacterized protein n=1 Tax=Rhodonia placenta TaxID=104341 RepID=A0A8H7NU21_9APHY|nr:hypothetical protein IEO21_09602 [Postia placenta]
MSSKARARE